jgi:hypothetical protein
MKKHNAYFETNTDPIDEPIETQHMLANKAVSVYTVRGSSSAPGNKRTSPTLESDFNNNEPLDSHVFSSLVAPLPDAYNNPQDATKRIGHTAGAGGGGNRKTPGGKMHQRVMAAGGSNAQQIYQKEYELNPISHPMAGGNMPAHLNLRQQEKGGQFAFFPMSTGQIAPNDPRATPKNNAQFRTQQKLRRPMQSHVMSQTQRNSQKGN